MLAVQGISAAIDQFGGCCCLCGRPSCGVEVKEGKIKRHFWNVERKPICIPAVRFPWQKCGELHCGRVRAVRVMAIEEYDVPVCEYNWKAPPLCDECRTKVDEKAGEPKKPEGDKKAKTASRSDVDEGNGRDLNGHPPARIVTRDSENNAEVD